MNFAFEFIVICGANLIPEVKQQPYRSFLFIRPFQNLIVILFFPWYFPDPPVKYMIVVKHCESS